MIRSARIFEMVLQNGQVLLGTPDSLFFSFNEIEVDDIVEMYPIRKRLLKRLNGNFSTGLSYTKSSDVFEFNFSGAINYRVPKLESSLTANSYINNKADDTLYTNEQDVKFTTIAYFGKFFLSGGAFEWQQNSELGLKNRFAVSGYYGKVLAVDNHNRLSTYTGLSANQEQSIQSSVYKSNLEVPLVVSYKRFFYSSPKQSIDANFNAFPSLSDWGRVRLEFSVATSTELFKNFNSGINFYYKYDNRPPEGAPSTNDFAINFNITYKFNQ